MALHFAAKPESNADKDLQLARIESQQESDQLGLTRKAQAFVDEVAFVRVRVVDEALQLTALSLESPAAQRCRSRRFDPPGKPQPGPSARPARRPGRSCPGLPSPGTLRALALLRCAALPYYLLAVTVCIAVARMKGV